MVAERYHGSAVRAWAESVIRPVNRGFRQLRLAFQRNRDDPVVDEFLREAQAAAARGDETGALARARAAADRADAGASTSTFAVGAALVCLGDCRRGLALMAPRKVSVGGYPEWRGEDLGNATLIVRQRVKSDLGSAIRLVRFVADAERIARRTIVLVEPRLAPLFQRTFARAEVRPIDGDLAALGITGDAYVTSLEALAAHFVTDWESISSTFIPLRHDTGRAAEFRQRYGAVAKGPVVGITWGSHNARKGVPSLAEWASFVQSFPATFVSLQYGAVDAALRKLRGTTPEKLVVDSSVDQLRDMDTFAAQLAAMDAVIAISNTAAHLAGAMGVPTVLLRDERFGIFPMSGASSGWYPSTVLVHQRQRPWTAALAEAGTRLPGMLAGTASR